eukprot:116175_1
MPASACSRGGGGVTIVRGPEGQVVSEELHDQSGVFVFFLVEGIDLSNSVLEGLLGELDGLVGVVQNLVLEDGVVQTETKTDGVGGLEVLGELGSV